MRRAFFWVFLVFAAFAMGCGTDDVGSGKGDDSCSLDTDCPSGNYCGAGNACVQDCDPADPADSSCAAGESCDIRGRCVTDGECRDDGDCDSPPDGLSCDGSTLVGFESSGRCVSGTDGVTACEYDEIRTTCEGGCQNGACQADPCENVACNEPPVSTCTMDGMNRVVYSSMGSCSEGVCDYQMSIESCALGCTNGVCNAGTCDNVTCDTPPGATCDDNTAITYEATGTCEDQDGTAVCVYPISFDNCDYTGATCNNAACENPITQVGGVVIVEYMANPDDNASDRNEWFEIVNLSGAAIDLTNWEIRSGGGANGEMHVIADNANTTVPAFADGGRLLFAAEMDAAGTATVDYKYDDISLANNGDFIEIWNPQGEVVDRVYWEPGAVLSGRSRKLDPVNMATVSLNDDFSEWCPSLTDEYTTSPSNFGTPGESNTGCDPDPCANFTCAKPDNFCVSDTEAVQFSDNGAMCENTRFNNPYCDFEPTNVTCAQAELCAVGNCEQIPANVPQAGDVIFTEFMGNPSAVSDSNGEWFELLNTTGADLSLFSLKFKDNEMGGSADEYTFLDINATIPANGYLVFGKNTDTNLNGGFTANGEFSGSHLKNSNIAATYEITLERQDGTVIDTSYYGGVAGSSNLPNGASIQLDSGSLTAAGNDAGTAWCEGVQTYGAGDKGTPGAANDVCQ